MKQKVRKVLVLALLCGGTKAALAEAPFAVDVLMGKAKQTTEVSSGREFSGDDVSVGIRGSYVYNRYAAVELAYVDFGKYEDSFSPAAGTLVTEQFGAKAWMLGGKVMWPVNDRFNVHARAGFARWDLSLEERVSTHSDTFSGSDTGTDLYYGVGVDVSLGEHWRVSLEHTILKFDGKIGMGALKEDVANTSVAVGYRF